MQSESPKPHSFLSDNSVHLARFARDIQKAPSVRNIVILLSALLVISAVVSGVWIMVAKKTEKPYAVAVVPERGFSFRVDFYKRAALQTSREKTYLVASDAKGYKTAIWVAKMDSTLNCGRSPSFAYDAPIGTVVHASCYEEDRLTFAADVIVNEQVYQINMTSEKPLSVTEAKKIFSSVIIEE